MTIEQTNDRYRAKCRGTFFLSFFFLSILKRLHSSLLVMFNPNKGLSSTVSVSLSDSAISDGYDRRSPFLLCIILAHTHIRTLVLPHLCHSSSGGQYDADADDDDKRNKTQKKKFDLDQTRNTFADGQTKIEVSCGGASSTFDPIISLSSWTIYMNCLCVSLSYHYDDHHHYH